MYEVDGRPGMKPHVAVWAMVLTGIGWLLGGCCVAAVLADTGGSDYGGQFRGDGAVAFTKALVVLAAVAVLAPVNISVIAWYARFTATMWIFAGLAISGLLFGGLVIVWDQLTRTPGG